MANHRFAMQITIGGLLPVAQLGALFDAVLREGVSHEWDGGPFADSPEHLAELIAVDEPAPLEMFDLAHAGRFDDLEAFCIRNNLTFVVHSSASEEADAELRWWEPGYDAVRYNDALENGTPVFSRATILAAMGSGPHGKRNARLRTWLARQTPPRVPPLLLQA